MEQIYFSHKIHQLPLLAFSIVDVDSPKTLLGVLVKNMSRKQIVCFEWVICLLVSLKIVNCELSSEIRGNRNGGTAGIERRRSQNM
jgi:hypothetical protein